MGWLVTAPLQRFERRSTSTLAHPRSPRRLSQNLSQSSQASPKALRTSGSTPNITSHSKNVPSINVVLSEPPADPTEIPPHSVGQGHSRPPSDPKFLSAPSPILLHHASDPPPSLAASFHATLGVPASAPTSFTAGPSMDEAPIGKGDGSGSPSTVPHMNPLDDNTDPTPFASKPYILAALVHPKTLKDLDTMGGLEGLCVGLVPNTTKGPSTHSLGQGARDGENSGGEGAFAADRQRVYGANSLPTRSSKSFALKDKILVLLCIAAIVPLALVIYQDVGVVHKPEPCTNDPTRPCDPPRVDFMEGVAIMIAIMNDVLVASLNDWQKVRQFRALNEKKEDRTVKVIRNGREQQVNIIDVLIGAIALLEPREIIPCDGVLITGHNIRCDESGATGESDTIKKVTPEEALEDWRSNTETKKDPFIISGSKVLEGAGQYVIIAIGPKSFNGRI